MGGDITYILDVVTSAKHLWLFRDLLMPKHTSPNLFWDLDSCPGLCLTASDTFEALNRVLAERIAVVPTCRSVHQAMLSIYLPEPSER